MRVRYVGEMLGAAPEHSITVSSGMEQMRFELVENLFPKNSYFVEKTKEVDERLNAPNL